MTQKKRVQVRRRKPKAEAAKPPLKQKAWSWVVLALMLIWVIIRINGSAASSVTEDTAESPQKSETGGSIEVPDLPQSQVRFVDAVNRSRLAYEAAPNELKRSAIRTDRAREIESILSESREAQLWVGKIVDMSTTSAGMAALTVELESARVELKTWSNPLSDFGAGTLISQEAPLYHAVADLKEGQRVVFSGSFFPDDRDYIEESSMTEAGSVQSPEFIFRFTEVKGHP